MRGGTGSGRYRKKIVLDTTPQGGDIKEALTDFPVLVRLHTGNFTFENAKADGSDIRFVASDDKTPLKYHIERYDPKEEMVLIWVKVPQVAPASSGGVRLALLRQWQRRSRRGCRGHLRHAPACRLPPRGKGRPAAGCHLVQEQRKEFTGKLGTPSPIGRGITLKGEGDRLVIAKSPSLAFAKGFTFSAWVRSARSQQEGRLFSLGRREAIDGDRGGRDKALRRPLGPEEKDRHRQG